MTDTKQHSEGAISAAREIRKSIHGLTEASDKYFAEIIDRECSVDEFEKREKDNLAAFIIIKDLALESHEAGVLVGKASDIIELCTRQIALSTPKKEGATP